MNRFGLTIIETIMSLLIISLILFTAMVAQINNRAAILKTEAKMTAETMILAATEQMTKSTDYVELETWILAQSPIPLITSLNCATSAVPIPCTVFAVQLEQSESEIVNRVNYQNMTILFEDVVIDQTFSYIPFTVTLEYVEGRTVSFVGELHE